MATLKLNNTTILTENNGLVNFPSGTLGSDVKFPTGHIIQIVQATENSYTLYDVAANSTLDWISKTITRKYTSSKIQIIFSGHYGRNGNADDGVRLDRTIDNTTTSLGTGSDTSRSYLNIWSPGTDSGYLQTAGGGIYPIAPVSFSYLDSPGGNVLDVTFTVKVWVESAKRIYPNGDGWRGANSLQAHSTMAKLILMEVAA